VPKLSELLLEVLADLPAKGIRLDLDLIISHIWSIQHQLPDIGNIFQSQLPKNFLLDRHVAPADPREL
jgi:hypothetical protein